MANTPNSRCPGCDVGVGDRHLEGCEVERCPNCGHQKISCGCPVDEDSFVEWSGTWPGLKECREFGWYARLVHGKGWVPCSGDAPGAEEDLNRLYSDAVWSREEKRFIKRA